MVPACLSAGACLDTTTGRCMLQMRGATIVLHLGQESDRQRRVQQVDLWCSVRHRGQDVLSVIIAEIVP